MSENPPLTDSAQRALQQILKLLERRAFNGEIRIVIAQGGVRDLRVIASRKNR